MARRRVELNFLAFPESHNIGTIFAPNSHYLEQMLFFFKEWFRQVCLTSCVWKQSHFIGIGIGSISMGSSKVEYGEERTRGQVTGRWSV